MANYNNTNKIVIPLKLTGEVSLIAYNLTVRSKQ